MYLKSIEIQGFKSFANKIRFEFHNGITGIVGPNGSGKSNVADAVRWVLGEQRVKQLRGGSMQDVIFSGTEMRKPLGYAYVAITLDNFDHQLAVEYDEVTVARKLYRSGESEYLLNGNQCRLKDVNELFYDTGIGKEGYSIIGQGQIDRILSGKPEERRELFDEAAGIVKFKKRKAVAQKKLEDEKRNLESVKLILSEREKQLGPLERQSEKAKEYLKRKEDLKRLDVNYFLLEAERNEKEMEDVSKNYEIASQDLAQQQERFEKIRTEYDEMSEAIEELEKQIEETRASVSEAGNTRTKLEGEIALLQEQIKNAKAQVEHSVSRVAELEEEIADREKEKSALDENKAGAEEILAGIEAKRDEEKAVLTGIQEKIDALSDVIENDKNNIIELVNNRGTIRSNKQRYDTMLEQTNIRRAALNSRFLQAKSNEEQQQDIIASLQKVFEEINAEIERLNREQEKKEERAGQIHDELGDMDRELREVQANYHRDKSRLDSIRNIAERYDGYGNSIRMVMEQKTQNPGIVGVVADIIKVEKKYETAIETALGGNIQNIVTEDEETAKRMITFLKTNRYGRATFLPLTSITNPQEFKNSEVLRESGVLGMADEIVSTDPAYRNVARQLLGRIVVVDTMDNALKIARKFRHSIRMVTLEGELLVPGGAISGGAFKNNSNLLGRRREMDELSEALKKYHKRLEELQDSIDKIKEERNRLRLEIEEVKRTIQEQFLKQNTARMNLIKAQEKIDETTKGVDDLKAEQAEIDRQVVEIKENQERLEQELKESVIGESRLNEKIMAAQEELDRYRLQESEQLKKVTEQDVELEKARQRKDFEMQNVSRIEAEIGRLRASLDEIHENMDSNRYDITTKEESIKSIESTIEASHTFLEDSKKALEEMQVKKDDLSTKRKAFFTQREDLQNRIGDLDKEVFRLNARMEKLKETIASMTSYMWEEYEMTLRDASLLRDESLTDIIQLKKDVAVARDGIRKLGDVNVNAIEQYKEVLESYTFLKTQHDDLVKAQEELTNIISELDVLMRKQFTEKFAEIGREFDKVFKELFGGGHGTLELMEDEDILEAGIKINAQPPGKKLVNMMQMSGGEKALSAIALLFAIQNLKPSPFCLLDEIEAALDESNVGRYASYLHKLTKHTQFIVITHRRGTMRQADRLYGITMQEKGVSTLVSVNLIDEQLDN